MSLLLVLVPAIKNHSKHSNVPLYVGRTHLITPITVSPCAENLYEAHLKQRSTQKEWNMRPISLETTQLENCYVPNV